MQNLKNSFNMLAEELGVIGQIGHPKKRQVIKFGKKKRVWLGQLNRKGLLMNTLLDLNATQAAIRAGYSEKTAKDGYENLTKPSHFSILFKTEPERNGRC